MFLGKNFLRFYIHWSKNIRRNFIYLLIYRIYHCSRDTHGEGYDTTESANVIV